jgi:hypothetical protein
LFGIRARFSDPVTFLQLSEKNDFSRSSENRVWGLIFYSSSSLEIRASDDKQLFDPKNLAG